MPAVGSIDADSGPAFGSYLKNSFKNLASYCKTFGSASSSPSYFSFSSFSSFPSFSLSYCSLASSLNSSHLLSIFFIKSSYVCRRSFSSSIVFGSGKSAHPFINSCRYFSLTLSLTFLPSLST